MIDKRVLKKADDGDFPNTVGGIFYILVFHFMLPIGAVLYHLRVCVTSCFEVCLHNFTPMFSLISFCHKLQSHPALYTLFCYHLPYHCTDFSYAQFFFHLAHLYLSTHAHKYYTHSRAFLLHFFANFMHLKSRLISLYHAASHLCTSVTPSTLLSEGDCQQR